MMRRACGVMVALALTTGIIAAQGDVLAQLGSNAAEAQDAIFAAFSSGTVYIVGTADVFKTAAPQARAAMVTAAVAVARTYSTSADFARRYARFREEQKPEPGTAPPASADAMQQEVRKGIEQAIAGMEDAAKKMPQMKKEFDAQIAEMRKQLKEMSADKDGNAELDKILKEGAALQVAEHKQALAEWEKTYPVDPKPFIASRLREFLALSGTVDFTAKVSKRAGESRLRFENPEYEQKNNQWKYLYRAGKPAVDAARTAAQEWLKALGG